MATANEIEAETGRTAMPYAVHVGRWDQLDGLVEAAYDRFGKLDVLVNNAGHVTGVRQADRRHREAVRRGGQPQPQGPVPAFGAWSASGWSPRAAASIINVSTHGSLRPHPSFIPYAASKAGLNAMTEGLAQAFGPTVRVNTLMPGPFLTDISKAWNFGRRTTRSATSPCSAPAIRPKSSAPHCF